MSTRIADRWGLTPETAEQIAAEAEDVCLRATPLQRTAIWRCFVIGPHDPLRLAIWDRVREALGGEVDITIPLEDLRAAAQTMSLDDWAKINNLIFVLHQGSVFDQTYEELPGGGFKFNFGPRYEQFLGFLEEERERLGGGPLSVLDVGCWQGTLLCELLQRGWAAAGTDITPCMGAVIQGRLCKLRPQDRERFLGFFGPGPAHEVLPHVGQYDVVTCQETLEHLPSGYVDQTCDAIMKTARHAIFTTTPWDDGWCLHFHAFTEDQLRRMFHDGEPGIQVECLVPAAVGNYTTMRIRKP